ncbi:hypothetical protein CERZMDRAFT_115429 [Cercospora zeae-maydis SCOH1-5]|uniref:Mif2/CENP-C cupin domain-containing protein n=1 Tax=Cercospora zeae-maydis SCOH1-5 TaxID=717836 RepID=A0A6A6EZP0_9PEZI|nr:hypothetical protein CERZMDRAFT_115429 [Cercospora zeae-maydis SCOH1-5]
MAAAAKNATPGRRKKTDQQYFDVGKVGRKTGITLQDTGIRDEHGLEPVSGIFSSPNSAEHNGSRTLTSEGMDVQESSAPDVTTTLGNRRTPRLPPARQSPLKRTSIGGSPRRMSSVRPPSRPGNSEDPTSSPREHGEPAVNRKLQFETLNRNRKSIHVADAQSPFKPRHKLRMSAGPGRPDVYDYEDDDDEVRATSVEQPNDILDEDGSVEQSIEEDDGQILMFDDEAPDATEPEQTAISVQGADGAPKRKRGRPRKSDQSDTSRMHVSSAVASPSGSKRSRTSLNHSQAEEESQALPPKKKRKSHMAVHQEDAEVEAGPSTVPYEDEYYAAAEEDDSHQPLLDSQLNTQTGPGNDAEPARKGKGKGKGKAKKGKSTALKQSDSNRAMQRNGSPVRPSGSPAKGRGASMGPVSNVNLRAHTPAADAHEQTSRSGRNLIQPLKFWENEGRIWRNGEIEGIIRAEPVQTSRPRPKKRNKSRKHGSRLRDIEEESETESTMPDEWEEQAGVITGNVANWNPEKNVGDTEDPVQEDLAFAASSIVTRDVPGSDFKYAKIMTLPFFGAGVVEVPPEGFKRAKNSRKMQMAFFVHEGKVMVEVGATEMEVNQFAISKGGCWVVPRGNNYAITNESSTRTARIFFAQGCEVQSLSPDARA